MPRIFALSVLTWCALAAAEPNTHGRRPGSAPPLPTPKPAPDCTFEGISQSCALFDPNVTGPRIEMGDGTYLPNYAFEPGVHGPGESPEQTAARQKKLDELETSLFGVRERVAGMLATLPKGKTSFRAMTYLSDPNSGGQETFSDIWLRWLKEPANPADDEVFVRLPFPPEDPKANISFVRFGEVRRWLDENVGPQREKVKGWFEKGRKEIDALRELNRNPATIALNTFPSERAKRVEAIFEFARKKLDELYTARLKASLSQSERRAVEAAQSKLKLVKLQPGTDPSVKESPHCQDDMPNAFYDPSLLSVMVCPSFYNYPDASLAHVLGHELGHAVDPCNSQCPVCRVDKSKFPSLLPEPPPEGGAPNAEAPPSAPPVLDAELLVFAGKMQYAADQGHGYLSLPLELEASQGTIQKMIQSGALNIESAGTPLEEFALKEIYDCLSSAQGGGFRKHSEAEMNRMASEVASFRAKERLGPEDPKAEAAERKRLANAMNRYPECVSLGANSHMGEAVADWLGSHVLGAFLQDEAKAGRRLDTPAKRLAALGHFGSLICAEHFGKKQNPARAGDTSYSELIEAFQRLGDPHPGSKDRIAKIVLRNSAVRKAFGCDPDASECGKNWKKP